MVGIFDSLDVEHNFHCKLLIYHISCRYILNGKHLEHNLSPMDQALQKVTTETLNLVARHAVPLEVGILFFKTRFALQTEISMTTCIKHSLSKTAADRRVSDSSFEIDPNS